MAVKVVFYSLFEFLDDNFDFKHQQEANVSTMNDIGGLCGALFIGYFSDLTYSKRSPWAFCFVIIGSLIWYLLYATFFSLNYTKLLVSFFFYGFFIYATNSIAGACSADIAKAIPNKKVKAVSTVNGIIDGTGNVAASIGQLLVGWTKT